MFNRNIETELKKWKTSNIRKPLIIRGARQVGKTSVVRKFGRENFDQIIEINLEKKDQFLVFDKAVSVEDFVKRISLFFDKSAISGSSLLFIDEIQESKNIMELLRFFSEEKPQLHIIAAGSLLEAKINKEWSVPVGRIDFKYLYPMTFFEYLMAKKKTALLDTLKNIRIGEQFQLGDLACELFKDYIVIGGMPEVISSHIANGGYDDVKTILGRLQTAYIDDIRKYSKSNSDSKYLEQVVENGAKMAGTLFKYENFAGSSYRSREMGEAVQTVEKVMLLKQVMAVNSTSLPIVPKDNRPKKMIWLDTGLANFINNAYKEIITGEYKGKIMEQTVGQSLLARGTNKKTDLYYWAKDRDEGSAEVDFCMQHDSVLVGMEIKSGNVTKMKSLFSMCNADKNIIPVRVSWDTLKVETYKFSGGSYRILSLPFYLIDRWEELVNQFI
ncbi:MAG: AAA family ATPase [Actinomycetota bacterium]